MAVTLGRPGVYVDEQALPNSIAPTGARAAVGAFIGTSPQGPLTPTLITSWTDYVSIFGGFPSASQAYTPLPFAVFAFFSNGGRQCYILRQAASGAAAATITLTDGAGTPANVLQLDAANPGVWGNALVATVTARGTTRFDLVLTVDGNIVERWIDVSINPSDTRFIAGMVNSPTTGSSYVRATNLATSTTVIPVTSGSGVSLAGGLDGTTLATVTNTLPLLNAVQGPFLLNIPGAYTTADINAAIGYAAGRGDVFVIVDPQASTTDVATQITNSSAYTQSSYAAVYYPYIVVPDPVGGGFGATRTIPPGGAVMGIYVATDAQRGVGKAPAGINTRVGVVALATYPTDPQFDSLNNANINAIKVIVGNGACVWGSRTLKRTGVDMNISARRSLIYLKQALKDATAFAVFEPNDPTLWAQVTNRCTKIVDDFWRGGNLRGKAGQQAYYVICNETNNPLSTITAGEVHVDVGVALQYAAEFIVIRIGQYDGSAVVSDNLNV